MTNATSEKKFDPRINHASGRFDAGSNLPEGFLELLTELHRQFTPRQQQLVLRRRAVLAASLDGTLPNYRQTPETVKGNWSVVVPAWCRDQRNQMTGPADDAELVVKMLNSGAPGVMLDLEDSMANVWANLETGIAHHQ